MPPQVQPSAITLEDVKANIRLEKSGTILHKGIIQLRFDLTLEDGAPRYNEYHTWDIDYTSPQFLAGYPGKLDEYGSPVNYADYEKWLDTLPHTWIDRPFHCVLVNVDNDITEAEITKIGKDILLKVYDHWLNLNTTRGITPVLNYAINVKATPFKDELERLDYVAKLLDIRAKDYSYSPSGLTMTGGLTVMAMAGDPIDIGPGAVNGNNDRGQFTVVTFDNPANDTGTLDYIEVYPNRASTDMRVGTYYISGSDYVCRDSVNLGNAGGAGLMTFSAPGDFSAIDVTSTDLLGEFFTTGAIERTTSGTGGCIYKSGEYIDPSDVVTGYSTEAEGTVSIYAEGETAGAGVVVPTVVTGNATAVEETSANLSGNIINTGGENCTDWGFEWDTDSGVPYTDNYTQAGNYGTGNFTHEVTGLTAGELYYYRAAANNSAGWGYGAEVTFLTKPYPATSFNSTDNGTTWINLGWINGTGADYVEIRYDTSSAPSDNASGTLGFWGLDTSANITGLTCNDTYYFTIFTHCTEGGLWQTADNNPNCQDDTDACPVSVPTVTTGAASSVEETTATLNGNITATGGANATERGFQYDTDSGVPYSSNWTEAGDFGIGAFSHGITSLTKGELYYYRAAANNSAGWGYGSEVTFLTKPDPAASFTSSANATTSVNLTWANGTGMDYVEIRYATGSAPSDNTSGSLGYWGNGTTANVTGLSCGTTYHFRIFTHASEGGLWSTADGTTTCQDDTDNCVGYPDAPTGFTLTDLGGIAISANWTAGANTTSYWMLVNRLAYPTSATGDYEVAYSGNLTSANLTGYSVNNTNYKFSLWGWNANGYSLTYATANIGATDTNFLTEEDMEEVGTQLASFNDLISNNLFQSVILFGMLGLSFWQKDYILYIVTAIITVLIASSWATDYSGIAVVLTGLAIYLLVNAVILMAHGLGTSKGYSQFKGVWSKLKEVF